MGDGNRMKRIFMFSTHPLFSQGVETLLCQNSQVEFVGRESDIEKAIERIQLLHPDIVIVDHESALCVQAPALLRILGDGTGPKIIGLNLLTNTMCIYRGEQKSAYRVEDLLQAIENESSRPETVGGTEKSMCAGVGKEDPKIGRVQRLVERENESTESAQEDENER